MDGTENKTLFLCALFLVEFSVPAGSSLMLKVCSKFILCLDVFLKLGLDNFRRCMNTTMHLNFLSEVSSDL